MITREEAAALLAEAIAGNPEPWTWDEEFDCPQTDDGRHVTAPGDRLVLHAPDLARTVVALYDERDAEVARGAHWRQAHDEADRLRDLAVAVADRAEQERDALARTVVALRADLDDKCSALTTAWDENARLALELRRLRAAEAPGTDDEAFSGTGWERRAGRWFHPQSGMLVEGPGCHRRWQYRHYHRASALASEFFALDAMRAAVPGSV